MQRELEVAAGLLLTRRPSGFRVSGLRPPSSSRGSYTPVQLATASLVSHPMFPFVATAKSEVLVVSQAIRHVASSYLHLGLGWTNWSQVPTQ